MAQYLVVDFAGHGFQHDLSRALARRGHEVTHTWCSSNVTPHGDLRSGDGVTAIAVSTGTTFEKYRLASRLRSEVVYGLRTAALLWRRRPDAVLTSNVPLVSLLVIAAAARARRARWVLWLQDLQAGLAEHSARSRGAALGGALGILERALVRNADDVVVIDDDFVPAVQRMRAGVPPTVIRNWAVIDDLPLRPKDNAWAREQGIDPDRLVFLYAGTLGRKHPPELLVALADELPDAQVVVVSEGEGVGRLARLCASRGIENVRTIGFQPHERLSEMLGTADVLVAVLHASASTCSVPSKVLSYLCAGRAVLAAMPPENGAARLVGGAAEAGLAVAPEPDAVRWAARALAEHRALRERFATSGRAFADASFDVDRKALRFDALLAADADAEIATDDRTVAPSPTIALTGER
jgi:glycosyltransferase involved in cell wall biosynthesis